MKANELVNWSHVKKAVNKLLANDELKSVNLINAKVYKIPLQPLIRIDIKTDGEGIR